MCYPIFLPRECELTSLVVLQVNKQMLPGEVSVTMCRMREKFGVPKLRLLKMTRNWKNIKATGKWLFTLKKDNNLASYIGALNKRWKFNLARAPWWGRGVGGGSLSASLVRIMKRALSKAVDQSLLTYPELEDILIDIENCTNNRPLLHQGEEFEQPVLTPNI